MTGSAGDVLDFEIQVQRGRTLVLEAFHIQEHSPATPMSAYRGKGRNQRAAHVRERTLPDKDATRVRSIQAIGLSPCRVYATEKVQAKYSKPLDVQFGGAVLRAIRELNPLHQNWINCRYRPPGPELAEHQHRLVSRFTRMYLEGRGAMRASTRDLVTTMIETQVNHCGYGGRWDSWTNGAPPEVRYALGYTGRAWSKTYAPHWAEIRRCLEKIDGLALATIAARLNGG